MFVHVGLLDLSLLVCAPRQAMSKLSRCKETVRILFPMPDDVYTEAAKRVEFYGPKEHVLAANKIRQFAVCIPLSAGASSACD